MLSRRQLLGVAAALPVPGVHHARAADDPRMGERALGRSNAPAMVEEFFSLTCTHCAAFHRDTMPRVRKELVDTGRLRIVFHDYPLDQVALMAAMVARALPVDRYMDFLATLFATQDRWAFARDIEPKDELWKFAAAAGMSRPLFDATVADEGLRTFVLTQQEAAGKKWDIRVTPTFVSKGQVQGGNLGFDAFARFAGLAG